MSQIAVFVWVMYVFQVAIVGDIAEIVKSEDWLWRVSMSELQKIGLPEVEIYRYYMLLRTGDGCLVCLLYQRI